MVKHYSISPDGEKFKLPGDDDHVKEFERLKHVVRDQRDKGREIVVVMGVGFVGAVMECSDQVSVVTGRYLC